MSWHSIPDADEHWLVFEDARSEPEDLENIGPLGANKVRKRGSWTRLRGRPLQLVPEEALAEFDAHGSMPPRLSARLLCEEDRENLHLVYQVAEAVTRTWTERRLSPESLDPCVRERLAEGFPELAEWTSEDCCLRMLRALQGNHEAAIRQLVKAIECRVRYRELFSMLTCDVHCDIRVIGRDLQQRPAVYICARSQRVPLRQISPQILLAFEAAVKLSEPQGNGHIMLIADMYGFAPSLCLDPYGVQELGETLGSVFADRFATILMVDFSLVAQGIWSLAKPLLSEKTKEKINFVSVRKAREIVQERFAEPACARIHSSFDINRERSISNAEREAHAMHTSICDVPLGQVRSADVAG